MATIVSVNVGLPRIIDTPRGPVSTAIFKSSTERRLQVAPHNLEGDRQADLSVHGGENKAIYGYPSEHYGPWSEEIGRTDLVHGQFGENLTTRGMLEREVGVGDVFSVGSTVLQVSQPRAPCFKLGIRMGDAKFVKRFLRSGRPGFYFRIIEPGELGVGDEITCVERGRTGISVHEIWRLSYGDSSDRARLELALQIPTLGDEWRTPMQAKLSKG
jgi:MOSC domain-containing protein YiiM